MDVLNYQMFALGANPEPASPTFKRLRPRSSEAIRLRKRDSVISPVADAPSRWRAMAAGIALVVISICLLKIQVRFTQDMAPCRQYESTTLVEARVVGSWESEDTRCTARGCRATTTKFRSTLEKAARAAEPTSRVLNGLLSRPARNVSAQRDSPESVRGAHKDGLFGTVGKLVGACDTGISASIELMVKVSLGRSKTRRVLTTSE